jgi:hypothetical protein
MPHAPATAAPFPADFVAANADVVRLVVLLSILSSLISLLLIGGLAASG